MELLARFSATSESASGIEEDLRRRLVTFVVPSITALGVVLVAVGELRGWGWQVELLATALIHFSLIVTAALRGQRLAGIWLLGLGCLGFALLAIVWLPGEITFGLLALPTAIAALIIGTPAGLAFGTVSTIAIAHFGTSQSADVVPALVIIWGTTALIAAASLSIRRTADSLWADYLRMQQLLEQARDQQLELKQIQQDLVHANAELARMSERLGQMCQIAEQARKAKEEFVANVSHELRTPLNMIIGFSEIIAEAPHAYGAELPPTLLADVDVIVRNSRHLTSLVDDVLDLSQVEAGRMSLTKEWVSLPEVLEEALVAIRPLTRSKHLGLDVELPADVPLLFVDRTRIRQVLLNLISNAARFTEHGGIQVRVQKDTQCITLSVADSGPGIAPENQELIFQPFQQADASTWRRYGGTGLGLSISKRFVEMHEGRMWLESTLGKGSTFHFSLPLHDGQPPHAGTVLRWLSLYHQENPRTRRSKAPTVEPEPRLVVLESGNVLQRLLSRYLEGTEIVIVRTPERAVEELRRSPACALVINDPTVGRGGTSVMSWAADLPFGTPALACWVLGEEQAAAELGVARYLLKPVSREALLSVLASLGDSIHTILLVDDNREALQLFGRILAGAGRSYQVLRASSGQRALSLLRERKPDVVLLDLVMPGVDGYTVLREKARDPEIRAIPVVAISAVDPVRESAISNPLTLVRSGGLSMRDLLACLTMWAETASPQRAPDGQEQPEIPDG